MSPPTDRNRLVEEASPYLRAHADNPVNWQPWDETALDAAREQDVPIFLSIGYSACHWCHVMAEESFEDEAVAERLNERFVPIKIDREERPEIDDIYMTVCRVVRGGGCGWPLSVWLTPEGNPFHIGTYFPKRGTDRQPGFIDLLDQIATQWEQRREELEDRGRKWMTAAKNQLDVSPTPTESVPDDDFISRAASTLLSRADRQHGGFGTGQKFPQPDRLNILAHEAGRSDASGSLDESEPLDQSEALDVVVETLDAMAEGGLRDHLGGGFHRYCTDRTWTVPHFEKMLYDNAGIPSAFLDGYRLTGNERYASIAAETLEFVERELRHPDGGFYSSLDARSHPPVEDDHEQAEGRGVEGAYYVWTPESVEQALEAKIEESDRGDVVDELTSIFCDRYGVDARGNFEGSTVLTESQSIESLAEKYDRPPEEIESALDRAGEYLLGAREDRPRPARDEKVIAGWNGLAIDAFVDASLALNDPRYAKIASAGLDFVGDRLWDGSHLSRRWAPSVDEEAADNPLEADDVKGVGYLDDYAYLARAALSIHGVTGDLDPLVFARDLGQTIIEEFWDADRGILYYTPASGSDMPIRPQDVADQEMPSSTGVAVAVLLSLDVFDPDANFGTVAKRVLKTHAESIQSAPAQHPTLLAALERFRRGHLEITISGSAPSEWVEVIGERYLSDLLLTRRPATDEELEPYLDAMDLEEPPAIWAGRSATDGPTAYVCRNACSPPITERSELEEWIAEFQHAGPQPDSL